MAVARLQAESGAAGSTSGSLDAALDRVARDHALTDWRHLVRACRLVNAIWDDDVEAVQALLRAHPDLRDVNALGVDSNWGPPMTHAANLGRASLVEALWELGARDTQSAFERAVLQGHVELARWLAQRGARPLPGAVMGPAETQNARGLEFLLQAGAALSDGYGDRLAPVGLVLETYCRDPEGKHRCLELIHDHGVELPDTPAMAVHRGRVDLLERHLKRDPDLLARRFSHGEIYPPELGCHTDPTLALHGTPLDGGGLLHLCVDYDEIELVTWLLERGAGPDHTAGVDADGFGGHTALFGCVVSQPWRVGRRRDDALARRLLEAGADPSPRASLRKQLRFVADETRHEYRDVTPLSWGRRFHDPSWVNAPVMQLLDETVASGQDGGQGA